MTSPVPFFLSRGSRHSFSLRAWRSALSPSDRTGEVIYRIDRDEFYLAVSGGFAEVRNDKVIVLADTAERPEEIDRARAERARERAERRLAGRTDEEVDYARALAALARAVVRLMTAGRVG